MDWVAKVYSVADALAIRYANLSLSLWLAVFFLAAISGIALAMKIVRSKVTVYSS